MDAFETLKILMSKFSVNLCVASCILLAETGCLVFFLVFWFFLCV